MFTTFAHVRFTWLRVVLASLVVVAGVPALYAQTPADDAPTLLCTMERWSYRDQLFGNENGACPDRRYCAPSMVFTIDKKNRWQISEHYFETEPLVAGEVSSTTKSTSKLTINRLTGVYYDMNRIEYTGKNARIAVQEVYGRCEKAPSKKF